MKKKKLFLTLVLLMTPLFMFSGNVKAASNDSNITYERINGVYFYQKDKSSGETDSNHVTKFLLNGKVAYCIEPLTPINTKVYDSSGDWTQSGLSQDVWHFVELVGYYGYDYPGHKTDRYWLAAQELIWEKVRDVEVKFTTEDNGGGSEINIDKEKTEIINLVNNFSKTPDFGVDKIEGNIGDEFTVNDKNNILSEYDVIYNGKHSVTKIGNSLKIKLNDKVISEDTIRFIRTKYDNQTSIIYTKNDSQKLAFLRVSDPTASSITLKSNGGKVEIDKLGEKLVYSDGSYHYENIALPNVVFAVYANEDIFGVDGNVLYKKYQLVGTFTTNDLGQATLENLQFGKYFLIEGESSLGNMTDTERYEFEITKDDIIDGKIVKHFDFSNYLPKGTVDFTKKDSKTGEVVPETMVQLFTEDDRLIYTGTTDSNGKITIKDLYVGKYYIIERHPADGYKFTDEKIWFEITENGDIVYLEMTNDKIEQPQQPEQVVEVPNTASDDYTYLISSIFIISGSAILLFSIIGLLIYEAARKKK